MHPGGEGRVKVFTDGKGLEAISRGSGGEGPS